MSEQTGNITSYTTDKRTLLDYFFIVGGWFVSCVSLLIMGLIAYWAIKIPEKSVNNLPIINAIKGDIRNQPVEPGGKSFNDEDLSIYKNLENSSETLEKENIILSKTDQNFVNLREKIKIVEMSKGDQKDLTSDIEDALKEVFNNKITDNDQLLETISNGGLKLYLGSFDTLLQADDFRKFIKKRNDTLLNANNLKISERLEGEKKFFRVELMNIKSEDEGENLCSILSSKQFSCLLLSE